MKPRIFTENDYEMLLWKRVWEKAIKKSEETWAKNAIVEQLAADAVGDGGVEEIAQFLPELAFFSGEAQIHCGLLFL